MFTRTQLGGHLSGSNSPETVWVWIPCGLVSILFPPVPPNKMTPELHLLANMFLLPVVYPSKQLIIILTRHYSVRAVRIMLT